jgi:hypothetical protein
LTLTRISSARGREALAGPADFPLPRHPHDFLLPPIWELRSTPHVG